jgi:hypothetical protein
MNTATSHTKEFFASNSLEFNFTGSPALYCTSAIEGIADHYDEQKICPSICFGTDPVSVATTYQSSQGQFSSSNMLSEYNFSHNLMFSSSGCQITIMTDFVSDTIMLLSSLG